MDYYPFGMQMPGREFSEEEYRYGYQGSEKDDEVAGEGNSYTTHYRQLDTRIGRWLSVDPKASAWESPYVSMGNNPLRYNDILGDTVTTGYGESKERVANIIVNDLNAIYEEEYGVKEAFVVESKIITNKVLINEVKIFEPSTWRNAFEEDQFVVIKNTQYYIVANNNVDSENFWNRDEYTAAMFDVTNSKDMIRIYIRSTGNDIETKNGISGYKSVELYTYLPNWSSVGSSTESLGGVLLHELVWHKHPLGAEEFKDTNKGVKTMRNKYGLYHRFSPFDILHYGGNHVDDALNTEKEKERLNKIR